jgi:hypothetical protein
MHHPFGEPGGLLEYVVHVVASFGWHGGCNIHEALLVIGDLVALEAWTPSSLALPCSLCLIAQWYADGNGTVVGNDWNVGPGIQRHRKIRHGMPKDDVVLEGGSSEPP